MAQKAGIGGRAKSLFALFVDTSLSAQALPCTFLQETFHSSLSFDIVDDASLYEKIEIQEIEKNQVLITGDSLYGASWLIANQSEYSWVLILKYADSNSAIRSVDAIRVLV